MNSSLRITSILTTKTLKSEITGLRSFNLTQLKLGAVPVFQLPSNLRLGHLAERVVSELIKSSTNYDILFENLQIQEDERTIGELDFIIQDRNTKRILHVELAYKFYLYDPTISGQIVDNWIGPNRNDSLVEKLEKLKNHQFPLLFKESTMANLGKLAAEKVDQALCLLASLYIPFDLKSDVSSIYEDNIKGYYFKADAFREQDHSECRYYFPTKTEWGMDPAENQNWLDYEEIRPSINFVIEEKQSLLCWRKQSDEYSQFFLIWW